MEADPTEERRRFERRSIFTEVTFYVDNELVQARSIDLSQTGIRFETEAPISIRFRMDVGKDTPLEKKAQLVWASRSEDGSMDYGLEFLPESDPPESK